MDDNEDWVDWTTTRHIQLAFHPDVTLKIFQEQEEQPRSVCVSLDVSPYIVMIILSLTEQRRKCIVFTKAVSAIPPTELVCICLL